MEDQYYTAKEAMERLKKPGGSFYRDVREGRIPYVGKRPNMRFPKEAIDALAEVNMEEENHALTFTLSTIADSWSKRQIKRPYEADDMVPFKTILEWRKKNDNITMNVKQGNTILGWTTFLPLDEDVILNLLHNHMREKDIPPQAVKKWNHPQVSIYIPVIEVIATNNIQRDREIGAYLIKKTLEWAIRMILQYDIKNWYAIGTTAEGRALLEALKFRAITLSENGERVGYIMETKAEQIKIVNRLLEDITSNDKLIPRSKKI